MADGLVVVNGLPGSGKSTLGVALARELPAALVSKDRLKLAVAQAIPAAPGVTAFGSIIMTAAWSLAAAIPDLVIVESWFLRARDLGVFAEGLASVAAPAVEVWCDVPAVTARSRYAERRRDPIFCDEFHLAHSWPEWEAGALPLGITPVIRVDTARPVDIAALAADIRSSLETRAPSDE